MRRWARRPPRPTGRRQWEGWYRSPARDPAPHGRAHPGFKDKLFDDDGNLRRFVNVFVADDDVRFLDGLDTSVPDGETLSIIPAVAGG